MVENPCPCPACRTAAEFAAVEALQRATRGALEELGLPQAELVPGRWYATTGDAVEG
jgi:hypothetical protein